MVKMKSTDPAYWMLSDDFVTTPVVHKDGCYIYEDPEFAQMGLPLCRKCEACGTGHIAADDSKCDDCGADEFDTYCSNNPTADECKPEVPCSCVGIVHIDSCPNWVLPF